MTLGLGALLTAVLGPLLGAATDQTGRRKSWLLGFTLTCITATALLWTVYPSQDNVWRALVLVGMGALAMDLVMVFYNATLKDLAPSEKIGRWSGWGWATGYAGGLLCLIIVLVFFIEGSTRLLPFDTASAQALRASFIFVALWFGLFSLPFFLVVGDNNPTRKTLARGLADGCHQLRQTLRDIRHYRHILRFLIARMFYVDGLATLFAFGGVYAVGTFGMDERQVLLFGIYLNISAGIGALAFSWIDDWIGSQRTIVFSLACLILSSVTILMATSTRMFWVAGFFLGLLVGPVQAASRSYLTRVAPAQLENQMFGLYAFSGKATAFLGPALVAWITTATGSQRLGLSTVVVLFLIGFLLMLSVPPANRMEQDGQR